MYKQSGENVDYLLLHCPIAFEMWSMVFCLFGIHWVLPSQVKVLLASWQGSFGRHCNVTIWRLVPHCLMWCIWQERNAQSFEGCERSTLEFKSFFFYTLLDWARALQLFYCYSVLDLLEQCNLRCWGCFFLCIPPVYLEVFFFFLKACYN